MPVRSHAKPVTYKGREFESQAALARALGLDPATVAGAVKRGTVDNLGNGRGRPKRPVTFEGVEYPSLRAAARATGRATSIVFVRVERAEARERARRA